MNFDPSSYRNETEVESKLIVQYLLPILGYEASNWYQEVALGSIRLDFLAFASQVLPSVLDPASPLGLVIEAKGPKQNLDKHVWKIKHYITSLHVNYGVLTNGKDFRIYKSISGQIKLNFQCQVSEIPEKIEVIRNIIGRDYLSINYQNSVNNKNGKNSTKSAQVSPTRRRKDVKIIAIYHNKGGVGKTTVSVNLAAAIRKQGKKVLLIDLDSQANSTFATGLVKFQFEEDDTLKNRNIYHILESGVQNFIPDVVRKSDYFNDPEIEVIPAHISLIEGQYKLNQIDASKTRLVSKLQAVEGQYDIVIIDTPPSRDLYARVALIAANYLIIPSDLKPFANQGLVSVKDFIEETNEFRKVLGKPPIHLLGVLPSKISTFAKFLEVTYPKQKEAILNHYKLPIMDSIIFDRIALSHCLNKTITVGDIEIPDPKSIYEYVRGNQNAGQSVEEFEALATEVLNKIGAV